MISLKRSFSLICVSSFLFRLVQIYLHTVSLKQRERERSVCLWKADVSLSFIWLIIQLETTSIFTSSLSQLCFLRLFSWLHSFNSSSSRETSWHTWLRYCAKTASIFSFCVNLLDFMSGVHHNSSKCKDGIIKTSVLKP